ITPSALVESGVDQSAHWKHSGAILTLQRWLAIIGGLAVASLAVCLLCLQFGATRIEIGTVASALVRSLRAGGFDAAELGTSGVILVHIRLPRVLMGFLVGSSLASVGVALQALLRNPLADPYVLGVSSGAALGASLAMLFGIGTTLTLLPVLPLCGFVGGLLSLVVIYRLAQSQGSLPIQSLLLAGVILNAILTAFIMFITSIMEPTRSAGLMAWLMGSLTAPGYATLAVFALYAVAGMMILMQKAQTLNVLTLGEEMARSLGVETELVKKQLFGLTALLTWAVVSVSGMIGFVGMVVPHTVRILVGSDHRLLLPASALVGGIFLVLSDTIARTMLTPTEIPVGIMTALAGGPLFLYLLLWRKHRMV
ncbi:MAG: iron ABC transporter permease, partial [Nitrospirae bacterium]|nr:iron ABC transporter permease [Nitrospirota bacterium]